MSVIDDVIAQRITRAREWCRRMGVRVDPDGHVLLWRTAGSPHHPTGHRFAVGERDADGQYQPGFYAVNAVNRDETKDCAAGLHAVHSVKEVTWWGNVFIVVRVHVSDITVPNGAMFNAQCRVNDRRPFRSKVRCSQFEVLTTPMRVEQAKNWRRPRSR